MAPSFRDRLDDARKRLEDAVDKHGDTIGKGIDRAARLADERTGGRHTAKIASGTAKAKDALERLDGKDDDLPGGRAR